MIKLKIDGNCVEFTLNGIYCFKRIEDLPKFWDKENVPFDERSYILEEQIVTWEIWNNATNSSIVEEEIKEGVGLEEVINHKELSPFEQIKARLKIVNSQQERIRLLVEYGKKYKPEGFSQGWINREYLKKAIIMTPQLLELREIIFDLKYQGKAISNMGTGEYWKDMYSKEY